jgi:hypothetical protein
VYSEAVDRAVLDEDVDTRHQGLSAAGHSMGGWMGGCMFPLLIACNMQCAALPVSHHCHPGSLK